MSTSSVQGHARPVVDEDVKELEDGEHAAADEETHRAADVAWKTQHCLSAPVRLRRT